MKIDNNFVNKSKPRSFTSTLFSQDFHKVRLLKISDGDTFIVQDNGKRVKLRLLYIDTPEKFNSKKMLK